MNVSKPGQVVLNCRTCTRACKQYKSLQDEIEIGPEGNTTLSNMLTYCSSLSFEPQDGASMPQHICMNCLQLLEQSFNFKRMVIDSDELLRLGLEEIESNQQRSQSLHINNDQEYVMIELLDNGDEAEPEPGTISTAPEIGLTARLQATVSKTTNATSVPQNVAAYSVHAPETEPEPGPDHIPDTENDADEFIVEEVTETEPETETDDAIETLNDFTPADIEYVTIKSEYDSQVDDEDDIEIMDTVSEQMHIQMLDDQMVILSNDEPIDEVIGEVDADGDELLDIEREEHLLTGDSEDGEEFMDESMDDSGSQQVIAGSGGEILPHVCHVCNKAFRQQCRLNQHMRSHVDEKLYTCEVCGKKLKHLRNYKEHMLTHTNVKPHQCTVCSRFYRTTSSLAAHMRTHAEDKPYKCDQCGRSYAAFDHLRRHKLTHTGERPYACDLCDKAYYDSSSLRQHKISHTGEKAFTCEICGVGLSQKSGYKKHMLVHSGAKPHKCQICGRAFTFTSNLNAHVRLHSGEKPFKCDMCMKAFPTKKRLNSHQRVHNKEAPVTSTNNSNNSASDCNNTSMNTNSSTSPNANVTVVHHGERVAVVPAGSRRSGANAPDVTDQQVSNSKVVVVL